MYKIIAHGKENGVPFNYSDSFNEYHVAEEEFEVLTCNTIWEVDYAAITSEDTWGRVIYKTYPNPKDIKEIVAKKCTIEI